MYDIFTQNKLILKLCIGFQCYLTFRYWFQIYQSKKYFNCCINEVKFSHINILNLMTKIYDFNEKILSKEYEFQINLIFIFKCILFNT